MSKKKKRTVYSTNPDFVNHFFEEDPIFTPAPEDQKLRIWLDRIKGNKEVTLIKGFEGDETELSDIGQKLKKKCGTGGTTKEGEIQLQGDHRDQVLAWFLEKGYKNTRKAGG